MRFSCAQLKFLTPSHLRVLSAIEMGSKNHETVPVELIEKVSRSKCNLPSVITDLVKQDFIKRGQDVPYEGYSLTHTGYDNLSLYALAKEGVVDSMGCKIGVGKESDIYVGTSPAGKTVAVKIHRLGRICFKTVKRNRNYLEDRKHASWLYLSRLSAEREYEHMKVLYGKIPIPKPISRNRHIIVMEHLSEYTPLYKIVAISHKDLLKRALLSILKDIRDLGYIHGDYNEFNVMVRNDHRKVKIIDFPQMLPAAHPEADFFYCRDVSSIEDFFARKSKPAFAPSPPEGL